MPDPTREERREVTPFTAQSCADNPSHPEEKCGAWCDVDERSSPQWKADQRAKAAPAAAEWGDDRRYLTDDRDDDHRNELVISMGGNGDWYVAVTPEGEGCIGRGVRICTSGGAASAVPGLGNAIADAYRALGSERSDAPNYASLLSEVEQLRKERDEARAVDRFAGNGN